MEKIELEDSFWLDPSLVAGSRDCVRFLKISVVSFLPASSSPPLLPPCGARQFCFFFPSEIERKSKHVENTIF